MSPHQLRAARPLLQPVALLVTVLVLGGCAADDLVTDAPATSRDLETASGAASGSVEPPGASASPTAAALPSSAPGEDAGMETPMETAMETATGTATSLAPEASEPPALITISGFEYDVPATVAPGTVVTVVNDDTEAHSVTSSPAGAFDVNAPGRGGTATFVAPEAPGTYEIVCIFHGGMTAALTVD